MEEKKIDEISQIEKLENELKELKNSMEILKEKGFLIEKVIKNDEAEKLLKQQKIDEENKIKLEESKLIKEEF